MIKKVLKGLGVLAAGGLAIGIVWYFQALKVDGDPLLKTCWAVDIYDDVTGEKVVGAEDLDFDPETGTVFLSAYDRRAVAREIEAGNVTTQGGIYTFKVSDITDASTMQVTDISRGFKQAGNEFRPHGFVFFNPLHTLTPSLLVINRLYSIEDGQIKMKPAFSGFTNEFHIWVSNGTVVPEGVCDPYDLVLTPAMFIREFIFTDVTGNCEGGMFNSKGEIRILLTERPRVIIDNLVFPNGIILGRDLLFVSQTTDHSLLIISGDKIEKIGKIKLPIAPDNLTMDENDNLYVAGFPSLLDYFYYMKGWFGVKKSPSAAYRISPDDYRQDLLFKDDGTMISGATVALRAGDYLILGSGWDDNIAICSGMNRLD